MKKVWVILIAMFVILLASCTGKQKEDDRIPVKDGINAGSDEEGQGTGAADAGETDSSDTGGDESSDEDEASDNEVKIVINEVCSKNDRGITAADGGYYDWVELYNMSDKDINLKGYGLTDKMSEPFRYTFPDVVIPSGGYLIIFANKNAVAGEGELLANFGISASGESIALFSPEGKIMDSISVPAMTEDISYGRKPDGSDTLSELVPTPDTSNNNADAASIEPAFSAESGFYDEKFMLNLTAPEGYRIYYTTDGSLPSDKSNEYTSPIEI